MHIMTRAAGALAITGLLASSALAAEPLRGPLPAGKPAGVKQAAFEGNSALIWIGVAAVIAVTIAVVASDDDDGVTTPSTTGTAV
jgi:hypothetical protein